MKPNLRVSATATNQRLRAIFNSSVHELACKDYTAKQLEAWAPRQHAAAQWSERLRSNQPFIAEIDGCIAGYAVLPTSGDIDHFSSQDLCDARCRRRRFSLGDQGATISPNPA